MHGHGGVPLSEMLLSADGVSFWLALGGALFFLSKIVLDKLRP
jgi:hypothetical protein